MHSTARSAKCDCIASHAQASSSFSMFNLLTSPELFDAVEDSLPVHRERLFPPTETLSMFLAQALSPDRSCQRIVADSAVRRLQDGLPLCSMNTGAFCKARKRLPEIFISGLARQSGEIISGLVDDALLWKGRPVRLVDGTTLSMPDTAGNQGEWPQSRNQKEGLGFPICRLVGVICLESGALLDAAMSKTLGKGTDEQTLFRGLLDTLKAGDLMLADAFYPTYFLLCELKRRGIDGVFEQYGARRRASKEYRTTRLGQKDHLLTLTRPKKPSWMSQEVYDNTPADLIIRECQTGGKTIVTTMLCKREATRTELKVLYRKRWQIEVDLRNIKDTLGMGVLACKSPEMIRKEIWTYLLAYNLIRLVMAKAAINTGRSPRSISFKHALQLWLCWMRLNPETAHDQLPELLCLISERTIGNRGGRVEPRAVKRRPKPYQLLTRKRDVERSAILENGHPKRLK